MYPDQLIQLKEESLRWLLSILGALLVYLIVAAITLNVYHPDIDSLKNAATQLLVDPILVRPEPMESLLFRLGVLVIVPSLPLFYILISKAKLTTVLVKEPVYISISILMLLSIAAHIYFDFSAINPYGPLGGDQPQNWRDTFCSNNFDFYFDGLFLGKFFWAYLLIILPLVAGLFFIGIRKNKWEDNKNFRRISYAIGYGLSMATIIAIVLMTTFSFPYTSENKLDFNAVYYSMTQVYAGVPMLVSGFSNTYGLYPHFLNLIFQITGLSIFKFTLVMSLLTGLSFLLNLYCLKRLVNNYVILFLGFTSILFFSYLDFRFTTIFDAMFSCYPIRYLIPSVLVWLTVYYLTNRSAKIYWITFIVAALFILWNPEMGLVCYISWLMVNIYTDSYQPDGRLAVRKMLFHSGVSIVVACTVFLSWKLLIYIAYGSWPDMSMLFMAISTFSKLGFGLLAMSLVHPWNLMVVILILGFTYSLTKWNKKDVTIKSSIIFLVSLIALGYFVYFQGRSQNSNFAISSGYSLFLLTLLGDELWTTIKTRNIIFLNGLFVIFLFFISFSFVEILFNADKMVRLIYQEEEKSVQEEEQRRTDNNISFINSNTEEHERIQMITIKKHQGLYFDGFKRISAFNPGYIDLFSIADANRLQQIVTDSPCKIFVEPGIGKYAFLQRPLATVAATYEYAAGNSLDIVMLNKRKAVLPEKAFFTDPAQMVIHRKYTDDSNSIKQRINDAFGIAPVMLAPEFSIQVLFYSTPQPFPEATLIGNINNKDSSGFAITNVFNESKYFCVVNTTTYTSPMPPNQWIYYVANIYPDHLEVYRNGSPLFSHALPEPMRSSGNKLYIGNTSTPGDCNYFVGAIAEAAISNRVFNKDEVAEKWGEMQQFIRK